MLGIKT